MATQKIPSALTETRRDSARLHTLYQVNDMLKRVEADGLDIRVILPRVLHLAHQELDSQSGSIFVIDQYENIKHAWIIDGPREYEEKTGEPFLKEVLRSGLAGLAMRGRELVVIDDTREDVRWLPRQGHVTARETWSAICVPFVIRTRAIGAITLTKPGRSQFRPADQTLLAAIASQAASTIENARLYEEAQRQLRIQALLNEASKVINSTLNLNEILQSLLTHMNDLLNAEALSIALVDPKTAELVFTVAEGIGREKIVGLRLPDNEGISGWVMGHAEPALVPDTSQDPRFSRHGDRRTQHQTNALICAPIHARGKVLGTIQAINPRDGVFTEEDLQLLVNLANLASSAIANAQQHENTLAAEARYMALFEDSIDPIILTDPQGFIVEMNRRASDFFGYERDELISQPLAALHPSPSDVANERYFHLVHQSDQVLIAVSQIVASAGHITPVEVHAKRTLSGDQELLQWIYHDISQQVELEQMRRDLTAMLFHDLQSPLGNVISSLQLLEYELSPDSPEEVWSMLQIAMRSSKRLQNLIRSLLDIHRLEAGNAIISPSRIALSALIDEAHEIVLPSLEKREITLDREVPDDLPPAYIDEDMIRRVLVNLLDNAIKFNPSGQSIRVAVTRTPDDESMLTISVSDQGEGIPAQYREAVFEKFRRVQSSSHAKGLGLGLAFCRMAVEAHNGRIWVSDGPLGGAQFSFTVPIHSPS